MKISLILSVVFALALSACGGKPETPQEKLIGTWFNTNGSEGNGFTFKDDGTYEEQGLLVTSNTTAEDFMEVGTYTATDSQIFLTAQQITCIGSDPPYTDTYSISGTTLTVSQEGTIYALTFDTYPPSSMATITEGCFESNGFVAQPLTPVQN